jgi:hypothetical protein
MLDRFIDVFFLIDLVISFRTGEIINGACYFDSKGTALKYLKSWFIIDLVAAFPWWLFDSKIRMLQMGKLFKLFRLMRLLRLFHIARIINRLEYTLLIRSGVGSIIRFIGVVIISSHWFRQVHE